MADPVVRAMAFYWRDKLAVEVNRLRVKFMMGRTALYGQKGLAAYSRGAATMEIEISEFTPVGGSATTADIELLLDQKDVDCAFILGGKYMRQALACLEAEWESDSERGTCTGRVVLQGKKPKISG